MHVSWLFENKNAKWQIFLGCYRRYIVLVSLLAVCINQCSYIVEFSRAFFKTEEKTPSGKKTVKKWK